MTAGHTAKNPLYYLEHVFGYTAFRGQQQAIVDHLVNGGDALVLMPTGGGKSLCYQLPALLRPGTAIVISPLIALMQDQVDALIEAGVAAASLNSSMELAELQAVEQQLLRGKLNLLSLSPERLLTPRMLHLLEQCATDNQLALFAIDEAHCVAQWGHDFRPEYLQLSILPQLFPSVPRIALTATAAVQTRHEIITRLKLEQAEAFVSSFDRPNITYHIHDKKNPRQQLLSFLRSEHLHDCGIVYCMSRRKVDETAAWLRDQGVSALPYHAGMSAQERMDCQRRFLREEGIVMVATIAFGMGIDKPDVRFVAHLDLPRSVEGYYQETGRAGRDGLPANAWMVWGAQDVVLQRRLIDASPGSDDYKYGARARLNALLGLVETTGCRRQYLLSYFGEHLAQPCGHCDNCLSPPEQWDATDAARKALSAVFRTGQSYGAGHVIKVLLGERTDKVLSCQHDQVTTFGIGQEYDEPTWRGIFRQLLVHGLLSVDHERFNALCLTEEARPLLRGEAVFTMRRSTWKHKRRHRASSLATSIPNGVPQTLFDRLRAWRTQLAREKNLPAYVILHDASLYEIATNPPRTLGDLNQITGIGDRKLQAYGEDILRIVLTPHNH